MIMEDVTQSITDQLWQAMNLPESCLLNSRIYKKMLLESSELRSSDKKAVTEDIDILTWRYTLKPETINIQKLQTDELDYPEIAVIHISLKSTKRTKRIVEIIQRTIPYPLVLVLTYENKLWFSLANKRQSLADSQKLTVESFFDSNWIDSDSVQPSDEQFINSLDIKQLEWNNYYTLYQGLVERLLALQAAQLTGQFSLDSSVSDTSTNSKSSQNREELLQSIYQLQEEASSLKASLNKESQFNRRLELNMSIKHCEQQIKQLTNEL